ncbi:hypothetical protein Tco_0853873, partial [Tanacetum coccineum]
DKGLMSNVVGYATRAAAHKQFSMGLACCKKTCDNAQLTHECRGKHHRCIEVNCRFQFSMASYLPIMFSISLS